jgi:hypothetical protein
MDNFTAWFQCKCSSGYVCSEQTLDTAWDRLNDIVKRHRAICGKPIAKAFVRDKDNDIDYDHPRVHQGQLL